MGIPCGLRNKNKFQYKKRHSSLIIVPFLVYIHSDILKKTAEPNITSELRITPKNQLKTIYFYIPLLELYMFFVYFQIV